MVRKGFTVLELITVIAIIMILIAVSNPIISAAKRRASDSTCVSNLHQTGLAIQMYRQDYEAQENGSPASMGLPPIKEVARLIGKVACKEPSFRNCSGQNPYRIHWVPAEVSSKVSDEAWSNYVMKNGQQSILIFDSGHGFSCPPTGLSLNKTIALTLGLGVMSRIKRMSVDSPDAFF